MDLICPICGKPLEQGRACFQCENGHSFDVGRGGYLNLSMKPSSGHGDEKKMVKARTDFLQTGSYRFLRDALVNHIQSFQPQVLIDLGCGEGYYTQAFQAARKYGFDLSNDAVRYASRHDPSTLYVTASTSHLPLPDQAADCAIVCFAPVFTGEIARVLKNKGHLIVVTPGPEHLWELKCCLYETPYRNPETADAMPGFSRAEHTVITQSFDAGHEQLMNLFMMTPYYHRTSEEAAERLAGLDHLKIRAEFVISVYTRVHP